MSDEFRGATQMVAGTRPAQPWRHSAWKRAQIAAIAGVGAPAIAWLGRTLRWVEHGSHHFDEARRAGRPPIMAFWHGRILAATLYFRDRGIVVMTSENFDGEWIARIIERFGYGTARGSTSRGALKALVQLRRDLAAGRPAAFTLDGPRGPAGRAQPGAVWLAKASGSPILPFHIEADRYWTARSWDATQIPRPGSTVAIAIGEPFEVSAAADDRELERRRLDLEAVLAGLARRAEEMLGRGGRPAGGTES